MSSGAPVSDEDLIRLVSRLAHRGPDAEGISQDVEGKGATAFGSTRWIGWHVFRDYALAIELVSLLLLVPMIGAVMLARRRPVAVPGMPIEEQERRGQSEEGAGQTEGGEA